MRLRLNSNQSCVNLRKAFTLRAGIAFVEAAGKHSDLLSAYVSSASPSRPAVHVIAAGLRPTFRGIARYLPWLLKLLILAEDQAILHQNGAEITNVPYIVHKALCNPDSARAVEAREHDGNVPVKSPTRDCVDMGRSARAIDAVKLRGSGRQKIPSRVGISQEPVPRSHQLSNIIQTPHVSDDLT
ncbi:hypothetical protein EJ03DRAFT_113817 [Teratosphaeria nubilosa]|uniref:Uncharacterized protein n=1 Tax=Teratosphaeria nubilosa TaxID=161662 RepID=A0A6G1L787_9PEZI|nr:hypothetical protein EJ03DRAFT_113817 [Teratosphaeria nubilosa]